VTLTEVASQGVDPSSVHTGDSFTFEFELDLPGVAAKDSSDLVVEVFAMQQNYEVGGFHVCQPHMDVRGENVASISDFPIYDDTASDLGANIVRFRSIKGSL